MVGSAQQYQGSFRYGTAARDEQRLPRRRRRRRPRRARCPRRARRSRRAARSAASRRAVRARCCSASTRGIGMTPDMRQRLRDRSAVDARAHVRRAPACAILAESAAGWRTESATPPRPVPADRFPAASAQNAVGRRPRRERDEGRRQRQADRRAVLARRRRSRRACGPSPALASTSSSNDSTAEVTKAHPVSRSRGSSAACCLQVLDLDRDVVGDAGELARQRVDDRAARASGR